MKNSMWGGRFTQENLIQEINESISFDQSLYNEDINASIAHVQMLSKQNIISKDESSLIITGLEQIRQEIESGQFEFSKELEDIHMNIESRLQELIGDVSGKMHTARSRNDQVATDFKMWLRKRIDEIIDRISTLQTSLSKKAAQYKNTIMPGFTHLQIAQPITFGYHLSTYIEMFKRDTGRFSDCRKRLNQCPLGSCALAGTSFPIDRDLASSILGFECPTNSALDSVSDRDFAIEFLSSASICIMHLSRLAEEIIIWSTDPFKFISMSDKFTTGSSIMPQKRNPDAAELIRGKVGRIYGSLMTLLTVMKSLPLAYSKDMQEDKEPVFDSVKTLQISLDAMNGMINDIMIHSENMYSATQKGFPTATDLADWLVQKFNIPFRESHHIVGETVKFAEDRNLYLHEITASTLREISGLNIEEMPDLSLEHAVKYRNSHGGVGDAR